MFRNIKKSSLKLGLIASLAVSPLSLQAASAGGMIEGSSESTSAMMEEPGFEKQLVRINTGINLVRMNTDIIENMPVSQDSVWPDKLVTFVDYKTVNNLDEVKNDEYYSTVNLTNALLGRRNNVRMGLLEARLYWQASVIFQNKTNGSKKFVIPSMNIFPDISNSKTYTSFDQEDKVALIKVEAKKGNLYKNVEEAVLSLLPADLQESAASAKAEYIAAREEAAAATSKVKSLESWLDDDANSRSSEIEDKKAELEASIAFEDEKEKAFDEKENIYFEILASGAEAIESNFDESKVQLATKLDSLLDAVDNNAFGAISLFASASAGLVRGIGTVSDELRALQTAQVLTTLVGYQKQYIGERIKRMAVGTLLAVPNIGLGTYYAGAQSSKIGKYQDIVAAVLAGAKAAEG